MLSRKNWNISVAVKYWEEDRMSHLVKGLLVGTALLVLTNAASAQINCRTDRNPAERIICAHDDIIDLDFRMANLYFAIKRRLDDAGISSWSYRNDQRDWLADRNTCRSAGCLRTMYRDRIQALKDFRDGIRD